MVVGMRLVLWACLLVPTAPASVDPALPAPTAEFRLPADAGHRAESAPFDLPGPIAVDEAMLHDPSTEGLESWFRALGPRRPRQSFGQIVLNAARLAVGRPYAPQVELPGIEVVDNNVNVFQCVSLVEGALAMARCAWQDERTAGCFRKEIARLRYRHGAMDGFGSRLHYFEDWLDDNASRGSLAVLTDKYSKHTLLRRTAYMSNHLPLFPGMQDANERKRIEHTEARLSHKPVPIVLRSDLARASEHLVDGDIVAIATRRPDILVHHVGFVDRDSRGVVHLLHASSALGRVVRTHDALLDYVKRKPEREGVLIARPLPPKMPRKFTKKRKSKSTLSSASDKRSAVPTSSK